jgi:3-oxoacyl-[acyl-carrier protein] reductase
MSLSGKNCVVSGGARGIGAQIVKDLAAHGANVLTCYATDSSKPAAEELVEEAKKGKGGRVYAVQLDVAAADCGPKFLAEAKRCFGEEFKLHILVHNAGVSINASLQDITLEGYTKQMDINVRAPLFITQAFQPYLAKQDNGRVILISSISARLGQATKGVYSASKLALESFVMCWAK